MWKWKNLSGFEFEFRVVNFEGGAWWAFEFEFEFCGGKILNGGKVGSRVSEDECL